MNLIETIVHTMSSLSAPRRKFVITLLTTIQLIRGKMTFRNVSRYSDLHEKTYARQFQTALDFADCNERALTTFLPKSTTKIAAIDCTFIPKSGKRTYGLDMFYHASHNRADNTIPSKRIPYNTWSLAGAAPQFTTAELAKNFTIFCS